MESQKIVALCAHIVFVFKSGIIKHTIKHHFATFLNTFSTLAQKLPLSPFGGGDTKWRGRLTLLLLAAFSLVELPAQKIWEARKGCVNAQGNLAPGYLFAQKQASGYLNGDIEYFIDDRAAVTGAIWYSFATSRNNQPGLKANHAVFWGMNYHFLRPSRFDPFVGLTPGVGLVRVAYKDGDVMKETPYSPIPLISATVGCNYYVGWLFHFFVKVEGVTGQVFSTLPKANRVDELKFMAGLGWNLRLWKPKKHDKWGTSI